MKMRLPFSLIAVAMLIAASIAGADAGRSLITDRPEQTESKLAAPRRAISTISAHTYRSPGALHKIVIEASNTASLAQAESAGATEIADYGSFKLFVLAGGAVGEIESKSHEAAELSSAPGHQPSTPLAVRDDFNVLLLRAGAIDTTADAVEGEFIGFARAAEPDGARAGDSSNAQKTGGADLRLVQFVGPVKREWLEELRASGVEIIAYVPNNAYLVRGDRRASGRLLKAGREAAARGKGFIQWEGPYLDEYKIHPAVKAKMENQEAGQLTVAIQVATGSAGTDQDVKAAKNLASSVIGDAYRVLGFTNLRARVEVGRIAQIAALAGVVNIEPWSPPQLFDERAAQIIAAQLSDDGKEARGPGYMQWLSSRGFASRFNFAIDVSDTGADRGVTSADKLHPDFLDSNRQSRLVYARDYTSELEPGDISGHGTINLSIAGGGSNSAETGARDSGGYNYGLGIAPYALLGSSKIFQSSGKYDLIEPYTKLISDAYLEGARISSNSWGSVTNSYTIDSQEYDLRARDAVPTQAGNQEMVIVFAAGNSGPNRAIGSPGTAKNVISVGASENARKGGSDGCSVEDEDADSALDIAFFSSGGPLDDGRFKPDICAPGSHVQGAASQHPEFDGSDVCGEDLGKPYFPKGQTLYTWSSGTSHSTPQVAGAAALARQFFVNRGEEPSAALIKALLLGAATYITGEGAGGDLPQVRQGWGRLNLGRAFDDASKIVVNQSHTFTDSGQEFVITGEVKDSGLPFRVMLAWSDAPGFSGAAPWVNNLDLEVTINGQVYRGNHFLGQQSQPGGEPNTKDNVEGVWLPAGTTGAFVIRVRAASIAGDGVPSTGDGTDQDFALIAYNAERKDVAVAVLETTAVSGGSDSVADPGETVSMRVTLKNASTVALVGGQGTLSTKTAGVTVTSAAAAFPQIAAGGTGESSAAFVFTVDRSLACGTPIQFVLDVVSNGSVSHVPFSLTAGRIQVAEMFADDIESGESSWTHGSLVKKKKNRIDTWVVSHKRFRSGTSSWFTPNLGKETDSNLDLMPVQLPADGRNLQLVFYHTYEFEPAFFDGAVLEISTGGEFEDLGPKIIEGRYNGVIRNTSTNALAEREGWVEGRHGPLQRVIVDLSSYAGKRVVIRFRIGTDQNVKGLGWYVDDVTIKGDRVSCAP
jgi:subtilase family protein